MGSTPQNPEVWEGFWGEEGWEKPVPHQQRSAPLPSFLLNASHPLAAEGCRQLAGMQPIVSYNISPPSPPQKEKQPDPEMRVSSFAKTLENPSRRKTPTSWNPAFISTLLSSRILVGGGVVGVHLAGCIPSLPPPFGSCEGFGVGVMLPLQPPSPWRCGAARSHLAPPQLVSRACSSSRIYLN